MRSTTRADEDGFFTIWILGLCVCLLFIGGISLDLWRGFTDRRELTAIADAAAIAGASQLDLEAFKATPAVIRLDEEMAKRRALTYIEQETTDSHIELTETQVNVVDGQVRVSLTMEIGLTLTRVLSPGGHYEIKAEGIAEPRIIQ